MNLIDRPRFRNDLVAEPIEEGGQRYIDVFDPDTGSMFRFYDVEYSIACAMDGERTVHELGEWAREELGIEPSAKELSTVITTLGDLGYLDRGSTTEEAVAYEQELVAGVVTGPQAASIPVEDVELGMSGGVAPNDETAVATEDVELGNAGGQASPGSWGAPVRRDALRAGLGPSGGQALDFDLPPPPVAIQPSATLRPVSRPDHDDDDPTNLPPPTIADFGDDEVSMDLSDHLAISATDVKEAVRASKVMKAVELPADLQAALESADAQAASAREFAERAAAERAVTERAAAERAVTERAAVEAAAEENRAGARAEAALQREAKATGERAAKSPGVAATSAAVNVGPGGRPVVELPRPVSVAREVRASIAPAAVAAAVPAPRERTSQILLYVFLVVLLLLGAYLIWTRVLEKPLPWQSDDDLAEPTPPAVSVPVKPDVPLPPMPLPSAVLAESPRVPATVVAGQAAQVAEAVADGTIVTVGDQLVRFVSNRALEESLKWLERDISTRVPREIEQLTKDKAKAEAANNAALASALADRVVARSRRLEEKRKERDEILKKLEGAIVKAPTAGTVASAVKKGVRTTPEAVIATITPPPALTATFDVPAGKKLAVDMDVRVALKASRDQGASCRVSAMSGSNVSVTCPVGDLRAGIEVVLE